MHHTLPESKFLEPFLEASKLPGQHLIGDVLIVEEIELGDAVKKVRRDDGTMGSIITSTGGAKRTDGLEMNKPMFVRVLQVGAGYFDEANPEKTVPVEVDPGDIILVGRMSVSWFSAFGTLVSEGGKQIGIVRENEIRMRFQGKEGYENYFKILGDAAAK